MPQAARGELDTRREPELGVSWKLGMRGTVLEQVLGWERPFKRGQKILRRNAVTFKKSPFISLTCMTCKKRLDRPASSNKIGTYFSEWLQSANRIQTSGTVSNAPPVQR